MDGGGNGQKRLGAIEPVPAPGGRVQNERGTVRPQRLLCDAEVHEGGESRRGLHILCYRCYVIREEQDDVDLVCFLLPPSASRKENGTDMGVRFCSLNTFA